MTKKLLVMAGGTGGHIFPGLAVARELQQQGWQIHWLGTADRMEARIVPEAGIDISYIDVAGVRGNGLLRLLMAPFRVLKSILQARKVIKSFQPDLVMGMGGFASGPGGIAAWLCSVPLLLHEQNAVPGVTNKILSRFASKVLTGFAQTFSGQVPGQNKYLWVGNPVRQDLLSIEKSKAAIKTPVNILIVGGSLGAQALNQAVPKALANVESHLYRVRHQTGAGKQLEVEKAYQQLPDSHAQVDEFIADMASAYQWADLVICRAGALTVAEVAAVGIAAIFVPLPHAVDDHQTKNAQSLEQAEAALIIQQSVLEQNLARELQHLISDSNKLTHMAANAAKVARPDALARVVEHCQQLAGVR